MIFVVTFRCQMNHIGRISHVAGKPVGNVFAETTSHPGIVTNSIGFTQVFQPSLSPISHRNHYRFLVHGKSFTLVELKQPFPSVSEAVRPLAGIAIFFVPNKLLCPKPALFAHFENQFKNIRTAFALYNLFFDIQNECASWFEYPPQLQRNREKPLHISVWMNLPPYVFFR